MTARIPSATESGSGLARAHQRQVKALAPWFHNLHLPSGVQALPGDSVYEKTADCTTEDRTPLLESGWPKMAFIGHRLAGDPTNWWAANHAGVEATLRSSGLRIEARPGHEIYLCAPDAQAAQARALYASQLASATGVHRGQG